MAKELTAALVLKADSFGGFVKEQKDLRQSLQSGAGLRLKEVR